MSAIASCKRKAEVLGTREGNVRPGSDKNEDEGEVKLGGVPEGEAVGDIKNAEGGQGGLDDDAEGGQGGLDDAKDGNGVDNGVSSEEKKDEEDTKDG